MFLHEEHETRGCAISARSKMEIFFRYLADPGFQNEYGEGFGVHRSTVAKTVDFVLEKVILKLEDWIHFPQSIAEVNKAKERFKTPRVIGALDSTHRNKEAKYVR